MPKCTVIESAGRDLEMVERRADGEVRQRKVLWGASLGPFCLTRLARQAASRPFDD